MAENDTNSSMLSKRPLTKKDYFVRHGLVTLAAILAVAITTVLIVVSVKLIKRISEDRTREITTQEFSYAPKGTFLVETLSDTIVVYDLDGVTGFATNGDWKWNFECTCTMPALRTYGDMVVLTDVGGNNIWGFDGDGYVFGYHSDLKIISSTASENSRHVVLITEEEKYSASLSYMSIYENTLRPNFTRKYGTYSLLGASISSDDNFILVSGVYSNDGVLTGVGQFVRVRDGEPLYTFMTDDETFVKSNFVGQTKAFLGNSRSFAIAYPQTSIETSGHTNTLWTKAADDGVLSDILRHGAYELCIYTNSGEGKLVWHDTAGSVKKTVALSDYVSAKDAQDGFLAIGYGQAVEIYNKNLTNIGKISMDNKINQIKWLDSACVVAASDKQIYVLNIK